MSKDILKSGRRQKKIDWGQLFNIFGSICKLIESTVKKTTAQKLG